MTRRRDDGRLFAKDGSWTRDATGAFEFTGGAMIRITCYTIDGDLLTYYTDEYIRRATPREIAESNEAVHTGAFAAQVSARTLRSRCPRWWRIVQAVT